MPIYEYKCKKCGHTFEQLMFHEPGDIRCPRCEGKVRKLMSPFAFEVPDEICGRYPKGEARERCTECREGGGLCPGM